MTYQRKKELETLKNDGRENKCPDGIFTEKSPQLSSVNEYIQTNYAA